MKGLIHQREKSKTQEPSEEFFGMHLFERIQKWLIDLIWLTEQEQNDAGLYLHDQHKNHDKYSPDAFGKEFHNDQ